MPNPAEIAPGHFAKAHENQNATSNPARAKAVYSRR
jgi:hypothetical protein